MAGVQRAIQATGATLWYLPPYSPDLNPIELCFAKLKAIVRAARCRSRETLWPLLGECLQRFSSDECRNYFRHCGYSSLRSPHQLVLTLFFYVHDGLDYASSKLCWSVVQLGEVRFSHGRRKDQSGFIN